MAGALVLVVRPNQLAALARARSESLGSRISAYLKEAAPEESGALVDGALAELVGCALERGANRGLTIEWDLCRFCLLALLHGTDFDAHQWASDILSVAELTPTERMDRLEACHLNHSSRT